ncbi:MAG: molybdopterin molybdotransferase MoeA [Euryarchaeota archaeon]|jgi:molybdopterin molybdotransferase|nr:molybdopterin molybdotransferase MoeA [Euryarchaeota archaeon]
MGSGTPYFIPLEEAVEIALKRRLSPDSEEISIDKAFHRTLSEPLSALTNDPPFDNSAMDGFAVKYSESKNPPNNFKISNTIEAGNKFDNSIISGEAARIMTGAPIPKGADSIIPIEACEVDEENQIVTLNQESKPHFIRKKGENFTENEILLKVGTLLTPEKISLCAAMGHNKIKVFKPLKVAIISTGDELRLPGEVLEKGEIYESNTFGLSGLVNWLGHEPVRFSSVVDNLDKLRETLDTAAKTCDVIITSGGVSMGDRDFVRKIMEDEGEIDFWRIKVRPGSPPLFGAWNETPIFGLPGNPVSSHVVFRILCGPWFRAQTSSSQPQESKIIVKLDQDIKTVPGFITLRRIHLYESEGEILATTKHHQGSGNIASIALGEALTLLGPNDTGKKGEYCSALIL